MAEPKVSVVLDLVDRVTQPINGIKGSIAGFAKAATAAFAGIAAGAFLKGAVEEALEAEKGMNRLRQAVTNAGGDFTKLQAPVEGAIDGVRRLTKYSDDDLREALTRMITTTGDVAGSTENLGLVADLAAARNIGLADAGDVVAKAMNGNVAALNKLGVEGTSVNAVLGNLRTSVGGFAENEAQTFSGRLAQLSNGWNDVKEAIGNAIIGSDSASDSLGGLAQGVANLAGWIEENEAIIGAWTDAIVTVGGAIASILGEAIKFVMPLLLRLLQVIGIGIEGIGSLLTVGQNLLRRFGLDVGTKLSTTLKDAGAKIQQTAKDAYEGIGRTAERGEEQHTGTVDLGGRRRVKLTKDELAERNRLQKDANEQLISLARLQTEATIKLIEQANKAQQAYLKRFPQIKKEAVPAIEQTGRLLEQAIGKVNLAWDEFARRTEAITEDSTDRVQRLVSTVTGVSRGLLDAASAAGVFGSELSSGLNSVINLGESIGKIASGDLLGGVTQGVGALVNLGKTVFGSSDGLKRAIGDNVKKLESLRTRMGDLINVMLPGNQLVGVQKALQEVLPKLSGQLGTDEKRALDAALLRQGFTRQQLNEVAEGLGIRIRDDKGNLETDLLRQLFQALNLADTGFAETFSGQRDRIRQGVSLGAITDELGALLQLVTDPKLGAPAIARVLADLDLSTAGGRAAGIASLRDLFTNIGSVGVAGLGGANRAEFLDTLEQLIGLLGGELSAGAASVVPSDTTALAASSGVTVSTGAVGTSPASAIEHNTRQTAQILDDIRSILRAWDERQRSGSGDSVLAAIDQLLYDRYAYARAIQGEATAA